MPGSARPVLEGSAVGTLEPWLPLRSSIVPLCGGRVTRILGKGPGSQFLPRF